MAKQRRLSKQSGNTLLGMVLGLIIGLAIAVIVALYIARSPRPAATKNETAPDAANARADYFAFDPNRPLQGRAPSQPAPQGMESTLLGAPPGAAVGQSETLNGLDELQIIEIPPRSLSTPAQRAQRPALPPAAKASTRYYLQIGAYKTGADAEQQRARLALQGFQAKVSRYDRGGVTYYRVRLGPYTRFAQMSETRRQLSRAGIDTTVIRK